MDRDDADFKRVVLHSLVWPWTVILMMSEEVFGNDEDEEGDDR